MSDAACASPPPDESFLPFENACRRRGCTHIFRHQGSNPFEALEAMVKAHEPHCVGRDFGATHRCDTGWQPPPEMVQAWRQPLSAPALPNDDCIGATDMDWESPPLSQPSCELHHSESDDEAMDGSDGDREISTHRNAAARRRRNATAAPRRKPKPTKPYTYPTAPESGRSSNKPQGEHVKKSCYSESERKMALEADSWTLVVEPTQVVCRGCGKTIKLDQRSRYFPGLWRKHRERCAGVKCGREKEEKEQMDSPGAESVHELKTSVEGRCPLEAEQEALIATSASWKSY
ncbi:hypothetical protein FB451DRAFT_162534 [Mycena latifolia]|nr:hypothetical protein FB451DRAFT_162534 [Mycena latifolia]